jgi:nucleoside-diphosphate-sugar epimerase
MATIMGYLVTGGTGFLGSHLVTALHARGDDVVAMGRDPARCAALERQGVETIQCDLSDKANVDLGFAGAEVVFHVAALSAPWGTYREFHAANVTATQNVVDAALRNGVRRLVLVSSPSVTLDGADQVETDETKAYPRKFLSAYQLTKKLAEDIANDAGGQIEVVILRPKAIFGPGDRALLPRLVAAARSGHLRQIGDGANLVDVTYVGNVVDALRLAANAPKAPGHTYIITNGEHIPLWPLLRRVLAAAGCDPHLRSAPWPIAYGVATLMEWKARCTHVEPPLTRYSVTLLGKTQTYSIAAARRDLGYAPLISVDDAIEITLPWLRGLRSSE